MKKEKEKEYQIREIKFDTGAALKTLDVTTYKFTEKDGLYSQAELCYSFATRPINKDVKAWALFSKNSDGEWGCCRANLSDELEDILKAQHFGAYVTRVVRIYLADIVAWLPELSEGKPIYLNVSDESYRDFEWCTTFLGLKSKLVKSYSSENIYELTAEKKKEDTKKNNEVLQKVASLLRGTKLTKDEIAYLEKDVLGPIKVASINASDDEYVPFMDKCGEQYVPN